MKYKVLVVNDDSISAEGLKKLAEIVQRYASKMLIVAPTVEQSACSHKITIKEGIELSKHLDLIPGIRTYSITGSPADCVKFALMGLDFNFDIVFSGINNGYNLADDICYSGTVSAALEAEFFGKKGIAVSCEQDDLTGANNLIDALDFLFANRIFLDANVFNINLPKKVAGVKITHQGERSFNTTYIKKEDGKYYSVKSNNLKKYNERTNDEFSDYLVVENGYISITPLTTNKTRK